MGQALYRKYRSKSLDEIIGQEHVTKALTVALSSNNISHAYLFTGPRGVGKTSIARIMAHEINGLPYTDDSTHLDIIEIDAASNRRIDEIRDLRDRVNIAPTSAKYKVYIIDEVHMLTKEAFNALLKTLEEPPAHVIFILATTEAYKLPETIISRTQRFAFRPVAIDKVVEHLSQIAKKEKINITNDALTLIANHGEGSIRDSISLLDQIRNTNSKIDINDVQAMLGLAPEDMLVELIDQVEAGRTTQIVESLRQMHELGYEAPLIAKQLGQIWRQHLLEKQSSLPPTTLLSALAGLLSISTSSAPFALLEITLLKVTPSQESTDSKTGISTKVIPAASESFESQVKQVEPDTRSPKASSEVEPKAKQVPPKPTTAKNVVLNQAVWQQVLDIIKQNHNTLYGIARMAEPSFNGHHLTLTLEFPFHFKRLEETRNKEIITKTLQELTGRAIDVSCELIPTSARPKSTTKSSEPDDEQLKTISNIFGGIELLQSED